MVGKSHQPVLAPSIGAAACVIVREVFPRPPVGAVVLAHGTPLPFAQIRTPQLPLGRLLRTLRQALMFAYRESCTGHRRRSAIIENNRRHRTDSLRDRIKS